MPVFDIGLEQVSLSYATKNICDNVTVGVNEGDRIGIVGRNGDGKTTVLHLLSGSQQPDSGRVSVRNGLSLGILEQYDSLDDNDTVQQAALGGQEEYEWASRQRTREIVGMLLSGIGLDSRIGSLSGGQRRRVDLARLLLGDWDILLLDEPTNHLDMATIRWLAEHLKNRWQRNAGALLVVTHDRWFLDDVCTHMWEVHDGDIDPFEGGYSASIEQRVERARQADAAEARRRNLARKELAWLARGARARSTKQKFHVKAARELIADVPDARNTLQLKQMAVSRLGKMVVDLEDVSVAYPGNNGADEETSGGAGHTVLDDITWLIGPGDRFGVVGANGAGKSTLLHVIDGSLEPSSGRVRIGKTVKFAVLSQRLDELEGLGEYTVNEVLGRYRSVYLVDGKETTPVQLMERLGFESAQLMTPVRDLSGGQKRRMQLLLILLDEPNVLIMDEPGNDLDTDMLAVMEDLLDTWPGTLI
ncbi:MAG: ABC-F family ATP-binding cassette domain-containing protein, partial [Scardovia wiggsiae]